ncbi:hypothetical protein Tco_1082613 [Tanacetum coccineum]|uniref:Uncharacterized protein n=1 Tax=Tanacetum coccineum TaxID=301880 RepID=A0ABQ5I0Y7_9ASTR
MGRKQCRRNLQLTAIKGPTEKKGIFISQDKYVYEILETYDYTEYESASTPDRFRKSLWFMLEMLSAEATTDDNSEVQILLPLLVTQCLIPSIFKTSSHNKFTFSKGVPYSLNGGFLFTIFFSAYSKEDCPGIGVLEDDLRKTKKTYSSAFTKLILRVKKLEARVKIGKARKRAKVVLSEDDEDDSSKQGRKLSDAEVQEKASTETEPFIQEVTPTEVIQDQGSSEKGSAEVSTAGATKGTASEVPVVSTAEENISTAGGTVTYRRRSEEKRTRKDKGKAIMIESEPKKKSKKELEQEKLSYAEAIRLQEQMDEEQRAQIARDEEIARQWDEEERQRAMSEAKSTKKIDWNDPSVIRPIFEKVWDFNQHSEPMVMEHGSEKMKSPKKIEEDDVDTQKEMKEVVKESEAKIKKSLPRKRRTVKRQKLEEDAKKEELKGF